MASSLQELSDKVDTLNAQVDEKEKEAKKAAEETEKEHKDAMDDMEKNHKDAMDDKEKEAKKAAEDDKEKHDAVLKAVLQAMDEEDKDKRAELVKAAVVEHKDDKHTQSSNNNDDEEKKALKAQVNYTNKLLKKPKLQVLEATYVKAGIDKSKLKTYKADWDKMTLEQLDGAIEKIQPLVASFGMETPEPLSLGTGLSSELSASVNINEEYSAKVDKMSTEELFA